MATEGNINYGFNVKTTETLPDSFSITSTKKKRGKWTGCQITFLVLGIFSLIMGIVMLAGAYQAIFDAVLQNQMQVTPGSRAYEIWKDTTVPLYIRFYLFNLTNGHDFQNGAKPIVEEIGPYVYREFHSKQNLTYHKNSTVTFYQQRWWTWDQQASGEHYLNDTFVLLNTIPVSAAWSVRNSPGLLTSLNTFFHIQKEQLIITANASDILFEGFTDPLLTWMTNFTENNPDVDLNLPPGLTDYDKFGWFYKRNMSLTYDGLFNMFTGEDTLDHLGYIDLWDQNNETDFFDPPCNALRGSAGELWPPNLKKDYIEFYSPDLCMSMRMFYLSEIKYKDLPGYRYYGSNHTFANQSVIPENECYCVGEDDLRTCAPTGLINSESCRMGAPAFISFPHFLYADPFLVEAVDGMSPDEDKHAFIMDLIPELGTPMYVAARMQINMHVIPYKGKGDTKAGRIDILKNVQEVYLPLIWFEELAGIPDDMAGELNFLLFIMQTPTITIIFSLMIIIGCITAAIAIFCHLKKP